MPERSFTNSHDILCHFPLRRPNLAEPSRARKRRTYRSTLLILAIEHVVAHSKENEAGICRREGKLAPLSIQEL